MIALSIASSSHSTDEMLHDTRMVKSTSMVTFDLSLLRNNLSLIVDLKV